MKEKDEALVPERQSCHHHHHHHRQKPNSSSPNDPKCKTKRRSCLCADDWRCPGPQQDLRRWAPRGPSASWPPGVRRPRGREAVEGAVNVDTRGHPRRGEGSREPAKLPAPSKRAADTTEHEKQERLKGRAASNGAQSPAAKPLRLKLRHKTPRNPTETPPKCCSLRRFGRPGSRGRPSGSRWIRKQTTSKATGRPLHAAQPTSRATAAHRLGPGLKPRKKQ